MVVEWFVTGRGAGHHTGNATSNLAVASYASEGATSERDEDVDVLCDFAVACIMAFASNKTRSSSSMSVRHDNVKA